MHFANIKYNTLNKVCFGNTVLQNLDVILQAQKMTPKTSCITFGEIQISIHILRTKLTIISNNIALQVISQKYRLDFKIIIKVSLGGVGYFLLKIFYYHNLREIQYAVETCINLTFDRNRKQLI